MRINQDEIQAAIKRGEVVEAIYHNRIGCKWFTVNMDAGGDLFDDEDYGAPITFNVHIQFRIVRKALPFAEVKELLAYGAVVETKEGTVLHQDDVGQIRGRTATGNDYDACINKGGDYYLVTKRGDHEPFLTRGEE